MSKCSFVTATMTFVFGLAGCNAAPDDSSGRGSSALSVTSNAASQPGELLTGSWEYVPSASCGSVEYGTINGNNMSFGSGGSCSEGDGQPFNGFTFEQPVDVVVGGTYDLTLAISNFNGWLDFISTQFSASIAGVSQMAEATSDSLLHLTFTIGGLPTGTPAITFNFRPPAAGVGPVNGGIFLTEEGCDVVLSLVRTN
jgi:hypothetical protein